MIIHLLFLVYTALIFIRVLLSWFPEIGHYKIVEWIAFVTDPYLNLFRRFIPPIGGVVDISPLIALFILQLLERVVFFLIWR